MASNAPVGIECAPQGNPNPPRTQPAADLTFPGRLNNVYVVVHV